MATTGSLFGTYSPQMQEPYNIESTLAGSAAAGDPGANALDSSYWFERQMREGQYADRMADQSQFAKQQLHAQLMDTYLKSMPELAKSNLLPATAGMLQQYVPGLDPAGLQYAAEQAAQTTQATNVGNAGRGFGAMTMAGLNVPPAQVSQTLGIPGVTQGPAVALQAAQANAAARIAAARISAGGRGAPKYSYQFTPGTVEPQVTITSGSPLPGYGTSVPPASGGGSGGGPAPASPTGAAPTPNQAQRPPPNYTKVDPATNQRIQAGIEASKGSDMYRDAVGGYVGNKPDAYTDGKGNYVVRGKSGNLIKLNAPQAQK